MIHYFIGELPATFTQFSKLANEIFPLLFDTKMMAHSLRPTMPKIQVHLEGMYKDCFENDNTLRKYNNCVTECYGTEKVAFHDAAYDAYITGVFFICYHNYIASATSVGFKPIDWNLLATFRNRIHSNTESPFLFD